MKKGHCRFFAGKSEVPETFVNATPSRPKRPWRTKIKRTDRKKGLFFGPFGRKWGVLREEKNTFFCVFAVFPGLFPLQDVDG
jgi:hypothetical protein